MSIWKGALLLAVAVGSGWALFWKDDTPKVPKLYTWDGFGVKITEGDVGPEIAHCPGDRGRRDLHTIDGSRPGYRKGLEFDGWVTDRGLMGIHRFEDGQDHYSNTYFLREPFLLDGPFVLGVLMVNTRGIGVRDLWGVYEDNVLQIDQQGGGLTLHMGGVKYNLIASGVPAGLAAILVWRDDDDYLFVRTGSTTYPTGIRAPEKLLIAGFGYKGSGHTQFDDYLCELMLVDGEWSIEAIADHERLWLKELASIE